MNLAPVTLTGRRVRLEPLGPRHAPDLEVAAGDDTIWTYLNEPTPWTHESVDRFIADALDEQARGLRLPFATVDLASGRAIGSTSYLDIRPGDRGVEIGWTWLTPTTWRTGINREGNTSCSRMPSTLAPSASPSRPTPATNGRAEPSKPSAPPTRAPGNHRILSDGHRRDSA